MRWMKFEARWASAAMEGFVSGRGAAFAPHPGEVDFVHALLVMGAASAPLARLGLRLAVWLAALSPLLLDGRLRLLSSVAPEQRGALLARLLVHRSFLLRELALYLKLATSLALFSVATLRERSHYLRALPASPPAPAARALPLVPSVEG